MEARFDDPDLTNHGRPFIQQFYDLIVDVVDTLPRGRQRAREAGLILTEQSERQNANKNRSHSQEL